MGWRRSSMTVRRASSKLRRWPGWRRKCSCRAARPAKPPPRSSSTMRKWVAAGRDPTCCGSPELPSAAFFHRHERTLRRANVELPRPTDLLLGVLDHFLPLSNPADRACNREQHGEHGEREAHRPQGYPGIEIDVGIELFLDEVIVL